MHKIITWSKRIGSRIRRPLAPEQFIRLFGGLWIGFLAVWSLLVILLDPYIYYHRSILLKQVYDRSTAQIPGVLKHFEYDTVLFGSSMTQNFNIAEINRFLNCRSVKATSAGLSAETFSKYFETAKQFNEQNFQRCLLGVDIFAFSKNDVRLWEPYKYLYSRKLFPVEYFFSQDTAEAVSEMLLTNLTLKFDRISRHQVNADMMFSNKPRYTYSRKYLERDVRRLRRSPAPVDSSTYKNLHTHLFKHVQDNPDIQFDLFMPPYSIYFWCLLREQGQLADYLKVRDLIAREVAAYPNVRLHDFQSDFSIVCNLENYKDVTHFSPAVNTVILRQISSSRRCFTPEEFALRTREIEQESARWQPEFAALRKSQGRR